MVNEQELIEEIIQLFPESKKFIGDDAALLELEAGKYLIAQDSFVEGIHFSQEYFSPKDIGWKALAINISDMAAMAASPSYFTIGLSLGKDIADKKSWLIDFYKGIKECCEFCGHPILIGGDITAAPHNASSISITVFGEAIDQNKVPTRTEGKIGFKVGVTGKFGNSKSFLDGSREKDDIKYHLRPEPRLEAAENLLVANKDNFALMDTSDGLAQALIELAQKSQVEVDIEAEKIPLDAHLNLELALYGGEDFELVCFAEELSSEFIEIGSVIGFEPGGRVNLNLKDKEPQTLVKNKIYTHF